MSTDDLRNQLAERIHDISYIGKQVPPATSRVLADALLPIISAHVEAERADAARTALLAAADAVGVDTIRSPTPAYWARYLRARAAEVSP